MAPHKCALCGVLRSGQSPLLICTNAWLVLPLTCRPGKVTVPPHFLGAFQCTDLRTHDQTKL